MVRRIVTARLLGGIVVRALTASVDAGSRRNAAQELDACQQLRADWDSVRRAAATDRVPAAAAPARRRSEPRSAAPAR